ncbi:MAG TPA: hypothetical protein VNL77_23320, partial [Roseiflexaceae bacterium]|nr:hypothetical protein [Roseiflexaceae bacterium]
VREALAILIGPAPEPVLEACQLPLELAVRLAGGELQIEESEQRWYGAAGLASEVALEGGALVLHVRSDDGPVGSCTVAGLCEADAGLLADLFRAYAPGELRSGGEESFDQWVRLVAVPGLGQRGAIAAAALDEQGAPLLAAAGYLGFPAPLAAPPGADAPPRPAEWLESEVVTAVAWLAQTARAA